MPELPEVETTRRGIEPWVVGHTLIDWTIRDARLRWPVDLPDLLRNQRLLAANRRGKYILLDFGDAGTLIVHLGMSGSLRILEPDTPVLKHDHVDLAFDNGRILRLNDPRRFGCVLYQAGDVMAHPLLANLGVEPLGNEFSGRYLFERSRKRRVPIKNFIMDSKVVVGVGNIYAAEALFQAGIRPATGAGRVPEHVYQKLAHAIVAVLRRSVEEGGTTLRDFVGSDGQPGYFKQRLFVYGRQDQPCRNCDTALKLQIIGQRSSVYCPNCQTSQKFGRS